MRDEPNVGPVQTVGAPAADPNATAPGTTRPTSGDFALGAPAVAGELGVFGPYRVLKQLGKGGMGAVYLALDTRLNRKIALKVMLPEFAAQAESNARFLREARAAALVEHAHVVTVYEADERDGVPYIVMQFLQGYPLDEYLKKKGAPPLAHAVRIAREAALGLAAAHERGLVHRDIKPANLWLEAPNGRVKILDFGLAKPAGSASDLTATGAVVGSPAYMSPEQARGQKVDARADVFSLGAVLYQMLTGRRPFDGEHAMAVLAAILTDEPTPVRVLNPAAPAVLADLVHQMLAKRPEDRPQSAAEVAGRLRTVLTQPAEVSASLPVAVQPLPVPMQVSAEESAFANLCDDEETYRTKNAPELEREPERAPKRGKALLLAGGALALVAMIGVAIALGTGGKKPDEVAQKGNDPRPVPQLVSKEGTFPANPKAGDECDIEIAPNTKMRFCYIPAGECQLGSPKAEGAAVRMQLVGKEDANWLAFEAEEYRGKFSTKGFWMGKYEVTQAEWAAVMRGTVLATPSAFRVGGAQEKALGAITDTNRFSVESVSWDDCQVFLKSANAHRVSLGDRMAFDLPHEDEWEYACRGKRGNKPYYFGNELNGTQANCNGEEPFGTTTKGDNLKRPQPVGSYNTKHPWGLCDLHGNVWEWCNNSYNNIANSRVVRGGAWGNYALICRTAVRNWIEPADRRSDLGFRVIVTNP